MPGDCHYLEGNVNATRRVKRAQYLLEQIGLEPERVQMFNLSSAMAGQFVASIEEMTEKVKALGLTPLHKPGSGHENTPGGRDSMPQPVLNTKTEVSP